MIAFSKTHSRNCPEIGQTVRIDQSEQQCRSGHGCEQHHCPLGRDFTPDRMDFLLEATRVLDR